MTNAYKNYFPLPNKIFTLHLCPGEIAVYSYLLYCENRRTYQCYPSYKTIGQAVGMSTNTVQKYIFALAEKGFIEIEPTSVITKSGQKRMQQPLHDPTHSRSCGSVPPAANP